AGSVHLLEWPELPNLGPSRPSPSHSRTSGNPSGDDTMDPRLRGDDKLVERWETIRTIRNGVNEAIEPLRRDKMIGSSLQAEVDVPMHTAYSGQYNGIDWAEICIAARVSLLEPRGEFNGPVSITPTTHHKCGRCWRHLPEVSEDGALCGRCAEVVKTPSPLAGEG
ncbi:MAG: zinc finger domain-containing protein, partial [Sphingopyxis sp.]